MNLKFGLLSFGIVFALAACGERGSFIAESGTELQVTKQVQKTDRNLTPRNTYVIEMPDQAPLVVGALNAHNLDLTFDKTTQIFKLSGGYEIAEKSGQIISSQTFELSGANKGDHPVLVPGFDDTQRDERVRAAITCLARDAEENCSKVILDLVVKKKGAKENFATQVEIDLASKTVVEQKPAAPKADGSKPAKPAKPEVKPEVKPETTPTPAPSPKPDSTTPKVEPTPKPTAPTTPDLKEPNPADLANQDHEDDEDDDEEGGLYVGTLYQDSDSLFTLNGHDGANNPAQPNGTDGTATPKPEPTKPDTPKAEPKPTPAPSPTPKPTPAPSPTPAPTPTAPKPAPTTPPSTGTQRRTTDRDQAIGMAANGTLEHPTSLMESMRKGDAPAVMLIYPSRERYYGTWELIDSLEKISNYMRQSVLPGYTMAIGDLAQKSGGRLIGSAHKSHQNGLDVDVAYPMMNVRELSFTDLVSSGRVSQGLRLKETFQLFEYAQKNLRNVDRIFVDSKIKKALCDMSSQQGMLDSGRATEVLRRLRPADGHDNHFHLRIRCSPQQPRCRMMAEPLAGSGCEAVR